MTCHTAPSCEACGIPIAGEVARGFAFSAKGYDILRCRECGLMWTQVASDFDPDAIYSADYFQGGMPDGYYDYLGGECHLAREFRQRVRLVLKYQSRGKLLEVGCATGGLLQQARDHFTVRGIDVSEYASEAAKAKGLDVVCGHLADCEGWAPTYDVVVLFDTIEHLLHPAAALRHIHKILNPGGYLILTTGDAGSVVARVLGRHWRLMTPPQHLWYFSRANIATLLKRIGMDVMWIGHMWRLVPISLIWYQLWRGRARPLPAFLEWMCLPVNLYDTMTVVARKPDVLE